jgi:hypothetical protein
LKFHRRLSQKSVSLRIYQDSKKVNYIQQRLALFTRQMSTAIPTDDAGEIAAFALQLLARVWRPGCRVLETCVSGLELEEEMRQLTLWE